MEELDQLLNDLVKINSINPDLVPGAPGEGKIASYIAHWLEQNGIEVQLVESVPGRPNVVGIARGTGGGKTLMLNGHMDTVGVSGMPHPHEPVIKNGRPQPSKNASRLHGNHKKFQPPPKTLGEKISRFIKKIFS